jgi:hypothetical protein
MLFLPAMSQENLGTRSIVSSNPFFVGTDKDSASQRCLEVTSQSGSKLLLAVAVQVDGIAKEFVAPFEEGIVIAEKDV